MSSTNPLDLNLASRPIRNNTLPWVAHSALLLVVLGGTVWNVTGYVRHGRDLGVLNAERDSFDSRMSDLQRRENAARRGIAKHDLGDLNLRATKASENQYLRRMVKLLLPDWSSFSEDFLDYSG